MSEDSFVSAKQKRIRQQFLSAVQKNTSIGHRVPKTEVEKRIQDIRGRLDAHFKRHEGRWMQKELEKLYLKHRGQLQPKPSPKFVLQTETSPATLAARARLNVRERIAVRSARLNTLENKLRSSMKM